MLRRSVPDRDEDVIRAGVRVPELLAVPFYTGLAVFALLRLAGYAAWLLPEVALASFSALAMSVYLAVVLLVKLKRN